MARRKGKGYSSRSSGSQRRIDREIRRQGLERRQALKWLREGKFKPYARAPERRTPTPIQHRHPEQHTRQELQESALRNWDSIYGSGHESGAPDIKYNRQSVANNLGHASMSALGFIANASEAELLAWAMVRNPEDAERFASSIGLLPSDIGYYDSKGHWHNIGWYHL